MKKEKYPFTCLILFSYNSSRYIPRELCDLCIFNCNITYNMG